MGMDIITTMICRAVVQVLVGTVGSVESTKRTVLQVAVSFPKKTRNTRHTVLYMYSR